MIFVEARTFHVCMYLESVGNRFNKTKYPMYMYLLQTQIFKILKLIQFILAEEEKKKEKY